MAESPSLPDVQTKKGAVVDRASDPENGKWT